MAATAPSNIPHWTWNLIIAIQIYEDQHSSSHTCLQGVLTAVPETIRSQADGISAYIHQASGDAIADKAAKTWDDLVGTFFPRPTAGNQTTEPSS